MRLVGFLLLSVLPVCNRFATIQDVLPVVLPVSRDLRPTSRPSIRSKRLVRRKIVKRLVIVSAIVAAIGILAPAAASADSTGTPGQPNQSCQSVFPSGTLRPQGFNTSGFAHAETMYAGSQDQNSKNPKSVSQYDVACFQAGQHSGR